MKFHCLSCETAFTVPDEKIPEGKGLKILCPKCRAPLEPKDRASVEAVLRQGGTSSSFEASAGYEDMALLDVVEEGVKTSLLCISNPARLDRFQQTLHQLDFFVVPAPKASFALGKLQHNHYDLVMLDEVYDGGSASDNMVLHHLQLLPMHVRRLFFLCLISETLPTLHQFVAFRMGVDMVLNTADVEKAKVMLSRKMKEHQNFYKLFRDELMRKG